LRSLRLRLGSLLVLGAREQLGLDGANTLLVGGRLLDLGSERGDGENQ
jgi:hypothetical protein